MTPQQIKERIKLIRDNKQEAPLSIDELREVFGDKAEMMQHIFLYGDGLPW